MQRSDNRSEGANVQSRFHRVLLFVIAAVLSAALATQAQTPAALVESPQTQSDGGAASGTATLHGHVADPTGALIPGAKVSVATADGKTVTTVNADSAGSYSVSGLKPGGYVVHAEFKGFAPFDSPVIVLQAGQMKRV